jgi:hypothetical protein
MFSSVLRKPTKSSFWPLLTLQKIPKLFLLALSSGAHIRVARSVALRERESLSSGAGTFNKVRPTSAESEK